MKTFANKGVGLPACCTRRQEETAKPFSVKRGVQPPQVLFVMFILGISQVEIGAINVYLKFDIIIERGWYLSQGFVMISSCEAIILMIGMDQVYWNFLTIQTEKLH